MTGMRLGSFANWAKTQFLHIKQLRTLRSGQTSSPNCSNGSKQISKCPPDAPKFNLMGRRAHYGPFIVAGLIGLGAMASPNPHENIFIQAVFPKAHCWFTSKKEKPPSLCLRACENREEQISKANACLTKKLMEAKDLAVTYTETALKSYCDAMDAMQTFIDKTYCAAEEETLDNPRFNSIWKDVSNYLALKRKLANIAVSHAECAVQAWRRLECIIDKGRACELTCWNPLLEAHETTLRCGFGELCDKKQEFEILLAETKLSEKYKKLVETFRRDLKAEMESLVTDDEARVTLTKFEADMVLTHAYKKILMVQKELKKLTKKKKCKKPKTCDE